jgi:hypothetical protein
MDGQIFQPRSEPRPVTQIRMDRGGEVLWCDVTGLDEDWRECPATACLIDDSGDGACYLVVGGAWGLRFRGAGAQWGEPYLLLAADDSDLRFS